MITVSNRVKELLRTDGTKKAIRIITPSGTLTNEDIVEESLTLTESVCSSEFKFGFCESSSLCFTAYNCDNLAGMTISAYLDVYDGETVAGSIFYGEFVVKSCKRKANSRERDIEAYSIDMFADTYYSGSISSGLSATEIAKRKANVHKANYKFDYYKFLSSNIPISKYAYDSSIEEWQFYNITDYTTMTYTSYVRLNRKSDGTRSTHYIGVSYTCRKYILYPDDVLMKYMNARNDVEFLTNIADIIYDDVVDLLPSNLDVRGCAESIANDFVARIHLNLTSDNMANFVYARDNNKFIYPYVNLTSADATTINNNKRYYIVIPYLLKINVDSTTDSQYHQVFQRESGDGTLQDFPQVFLTGIDVSQPRKKIKKNSTYYNFPYFDSIYANGDKKISLREFTEAYCELHATFGGYSRKENTFYYRVVSAVSGLTPGENLTPATNTSPSFSSKAITVYENQYSSLWYADSDALPWGKVTCTYKPSGEEDDVFFESDVIENIDEQNIPYAIYDISDNYIIKNCSPSASEVQSWCDTIAYALDGFAYRSVDVVQVGLPYVEAGDWIEYITNDGSNAVQTFIAKRVLKGIQHLTDEITTEG